MKILRRDFLNNTLLASGAALLRMPAPANAQPAARDTFTGYGGVGDYALSNGDTWPVLLAGHKISQGAYTPLPADIADTSDAIDLLVVGGGLSGLGTAYYYAKATGGNKRCLILENHPMFGGHCKQNEFMVNGQRLIGPQASNDFGIPREGSRNQMDDLFTELHLPREYAYAAWDPSLKPLRFPRDNYSHMDGINDTQVDIGYYFGRQPGAANPTWAHNIFANRLEGAPFSEDVKRDLLKWRTTTGGDEAARRHLDTITYQQYLEGDLGLRPEVTKFAEPVVGLICGASPDAVCARAAHNLVIPTTSPGGISFPGGNTTFARHLVRALIPDSMSGDLSFAGVLNSPVNFAALDRAGAPTRIRLGATVIRVEHATGGGASVIYEKGGKLFRTRANSLVMASAGWINRHLLADIPTQLRDAYGQFQYAPALSVNVALTNWRFLYRLNAPAVRYFNQDFGWSCNIRKPMTAGAFTPPLHPDQPIVLTFYLGLYTPGRTAAQQGDLGRKKLLGTSYADYEKQIRSLMTTLFHDAGFRPKDIAGIVLNRWGHARVIQPPGFYYGQNGKPSPREIVQKGYGKIVIAHSELNGHQSATGALQQAKRAADQL